VACEFSHGVSAKKASGDRHQGRVPRLHRTSVSDLIDRVPSGGRWVHEIKFDGYRVQVHLANNDIKIFTRRGNDWTKRFKKIADCAWHINAGSAIIDGEVVVPAADGTTDFQFCKTNSRPNPPRP
jgi:bifunctional non-homologous end joining protein LigD